MSKDGLTCHPCDCYSVGSNSLTCNPRTGQCHCKDGAVGRKCDQCEHAFAEVTTRGCEILYEGCPRSHSENIWWPRVGALNVTEVEPCPDGTIGNASRFCDYMDSWLVPDMSGCMSKAFTKLNDQVKTAKTYPHTNLEM